MDGAPAWSSLPRYRRSTEMRIVIIGQQDFGKAVLDAFLNRGDDVTAVFCAPERDGARPDALRAAAEAKGIQVHSFKSLRDPEAVRAMEAAGADIGIMAFVLQFAPQEFVNIPLHGTIQYHPSLLPKHRGPSSRSEERRVGKECRPRWRAAHEGKA